MSRTVQTFIKTCFALCIAFLVMAFSPDSFQNPDGEDLTVNITQVDTTQFPEVTVYVSVTDTEGEPVGVDPFGIRLEENGLQVTPDQVNGSGEISTLTTMLVMDVSGSMNSGGKLNAAKKAALAYIDQMRPGDQAGLLVFNTSIDLIQDVTKNVQALKAAVRSLRAAKDTAMYDALMVAVDQLDPLQGRKAIIVLTDGLDNRSESTPGQVLQAIGPSGLSISTIGLGDPTHGKGSQTALDEHALIALAGDAGGVYGYAEDEDGLLAIYERYARTLQSEYRLTYTSPASIRDGVNRALSVSFEGEIAQTGLGKYNPGGLVPEIASSASWSLFLTLLIILILLLLVPLIVGRLLSIFRRSRDNAQSKTSGRVKLHNRIKLKD